MKVEFEYTDGTCVQYACVDADDAWDLVTLVEGSYGLDIVSAWRDDEPWFGLCTDMREGMPWAPAAALHPDG
jgi:hypothetical protein